MSLPLPLCCAAQGKCCGVHFGQHTSYPNAWVTDTCIALPLACAVGSGPTCHLAPQLPSLAGVVLHAPFLSGGAPLLPANQPAYCS
jgi:hypothetical protein